jgi:hypothetical protein
MLGAGHTDIITMGLAQGWLRRVSPQVMMYNLCRHGSEHVESDGLISLFLELPPGVYVVLDDDGQVVGTLMHIYHTCITSASPIHTISRAQSLLRVPTRL